MRLKYSATNDPTDLPIIYELSAREATIIRRCVIDSVPYAAQLNPVVSALNAISYDHKSHKVICTPHTVNTLYRAIKQARETYPELESAVKLLESNLSFLFAIPAVTPKQTYNQSVATSAFYSAAQSPKPAQNKWCSFWENEKKSAATTDSATTNTLNNTYRAG